MMVVRFFLVKLCTKTPTFLPGGTLEYFLNHILDAAEGRWTTKNLPLKLWWQI